MKRHFTLIEFLVCVSFAAIVVMLLLKAMNSEHAILWSIGSVLGIMLLAVIGFIGCAFISTLRENSSDRDELFGKIMHPIRVCLYHIKRTHAYNALKRANPDFRIHPDDYCIEMSSDDKYFVLVKKSEAYEEVKKNLEDCKELYMTALSNGDFVSMQAVELNAKHLQEQLDEYIDRYTTINDNGFVKKNMFCVEI